MHKYKSAPREVCDNLSSKGGEKKQRFISNISIHGESSCLSPVIAHFSVFTTVLGGVEILILSRDCSVCELQIFLFKIGCFLITNEPEMYSVKV